MIFIELNDNMIILVNFKIYGINHDMLSNAEKIIFF